MTTCFSFGGKFNAEAAKGAEKITFCALADLAMDQGFYVVDSFVRSSNGSSVRTLLRRHPPRDVSNGEIPLPHPKFRRHALTPSVPFRGIKSADLDYERPETHNLAGSVGLCNLCDLFNLRILPLGVTTVAKGDQRVVVVVDSAASLPPCSLEPWLRIVPMQLTIEANTYSDGLGLSPTEFYRMLRKMDKVPTTAAPSPSAFLDAFRSAAEDAHSIVCLTVSLRFSSTYDSAAVAARQAMAEMPGVQVAVIDSESAAGGEGLVATEAWRAADRGEHLEGVAAAARAVISKVSLIAFLDTLYYVWKGGRVPGVAYAGASLLRIKPMFELTRGEVRTVARPRTAPRAMERMLELVRMRVGSARVHATVMHADAPEAAEQLRRRVELELTCEELFVSEFSAVMGAHTGPGLLGIAFWSEP